MAIHAPSVVRVNAELSGGGHAVAGAVLGGTAGDGWGRAAAYDAYADGLHTYSLWYLHDHDAAADAVYCAFVAADRNHTNLQQPEQIQPWLYALLRHECRLRAKEVAEAPKPVSQRLRPKADSLEESGVTASLLQLEGNLRRAEFQSLAWPEVEGLAPAHREVLELTIRHGLDSRGLALVLGLREGGGAAGLAPSHGFGLLADAWRELERSLAAAAVAGSGRENCAQLAELTFGWSGKLNATLRAPLTDHVDRCSRCQHYLHTVIGTPSAPTILPFVAAPRALRDILLGELAAADLASDAGIDLAALSRRCGTFGPEGFPARAESSSATQQGSSTTTAAGAGRGPRRRTTSSNSRPQRTTPSVTSTRPQAVNKPPAPGGKNPPPRTSEPDDLFRAQGSWADKVLPPPAPGTQVPGPPGPWRPDPSPTFVQTPSGRFAVRPARPAAPPARPPVAGGARLPRYANPVGPPHSTTGPGNTKQTATGPKPAPVTSAGAGTATSSAATVRARHRARPMRQAVVSAMALGAIGAVAAAAAAMLGVGSNPHANTTALDGPQGTENVGTSSTSSADSSSGAGRMTVSVTTASTGSTGLLSGASGVSVGLVPNGSTSAGTGASPSTSATSGAFFVSVNQRDGDPDSVRILLRNTGNGPLHWSAAPSQSWLVLSQGSGTLAAGQSTTVTATATSGAPSGQWAAQIVFSPGGIVVTLHGGIPASTGGGSTGGTTPSSPTTSASPSSSPTSTTQSPTPPPSSTATGSTGDGSGQPTASTSDSTSGSQDPSASGTTTATGDPSITPPSSVPAHRR
jgi:DNA-directed RNA polymerase specialized sigma24 family protein